jgi:hypothetical protein
MREQYLLGEVAKVLGRKPHQIIYPMVTGKIPEPQSRIANKRLFTSEDVERLARHFHVSANWEALEPVPAGSHAERPERLTLRPPFEVISIGETGHEVRDGDGQVFAWAGDRAHALVVAGLLEAAARG